MMYSVFVGRIPQQTTKEELVSLFSTETAQIKEVYINKENDSPLTYGFVRFDEIESVLRVLRVFQAWRLHDVDLIVELSHKSKNLLHSQKKKSASVKSYLLAQARLKEGCHAINMELDLMSDTPRLNPTWVEERMERVLPKRTTRMSAAPVSGSLSVTKEVYKMAADASSSPGEMCKVFSAELKELMTNMSAQTAASNETLHREILAALSHNGKEKNLNSGHSHCPVRDSKSFSFLLQPCFYSEYEQADGTEDKNKAQSHKMNSSSSGEGGCDICSSGEGGCDICSLFRGGSDSSLCGGGSDISLCGGGSDSSLCEGGSDSSSCGGGSDSSSLCGGGCDMASSGPCHCSSSHCNSRSTSNEASDSLAGEKAPSLEVFKKEATLIGMEIPQSKSQILPEGFAEVLKTMAPESKVRNQDENSVSVKEPLHREPLSVKENSLVGCQMVVTKKPSLHNMHFCGEASNECFRFSPVDTHQQNGFENGFSEKLQQETYSLSEIDAVEKCVEGYPLSSPKTYDVNSGSDSGEVFYSTQNQTFHQGSGREHSSSSTTFSAMHTAKLGPGFLGGGRGKLLQDVFGAFSRP